VVIGDVGGHPAQLQRALLAVGAGGYDNDQAWVAAGGILAPLRLPDDVTVVQVGDLIDRGPDSGGALKIVHDLMDSHAGRWIQLAGNHEAQYLDGGEIFWPEPLAGDDFFQIREWWSDRRLDVAAAVRTSDDEDFLITHAGLTVGAWQELGVPHSAATAARWLNDRPESLLWRGGHTVLDPTAGPFWAEAGWELYEPWLRFAAEGGFIPFGQVHGHSSIVRYADRTWRCPGRVRERANVDWEARHTRFRAGGRAFIGVDPKHGRNGALQWSPLVLDDAVVTSAHLTPSAR
jgi:hypothetical protein